MSISPHLAAPIARFDYRVRIAAALLRSATHAEHLVVVGMALTSAVAAWPVDGALYPMTAIPALLVLAALNRYHFDSLGSRRDALAAAGANPADTFVIQIAGPLCAMALGAFAGIVAAVALDRSALPALAPLAVGTVAVLFIRRGRLGAPALAVSAVAALVTALLVHVTAPAARPAPVPRVRGTAGGSGGGAAAWAAGWGHGAWPTLLVAVLVLAAAQTAIAYRAGLQRLGRRLAAAAARRLTARSSA